MIALNALSRLSSVPCQAQDIVLARIINNGSSSIFYQTPVGIVSRVSVTGLLVSWDGITGMLDDGSGQILIRTHEPVKQLLETPLGSIVHCIGRIRSLDKESYLSVESVALLTHPGWITYKKIETELFRSTQSINPQQSAQTIPAQIPQMPAKQQFIRTEKDQVLDAIRLLDAGDGADVELVMSKLNLDDDASIAQLIKHGEVYEIKPGKIKILE
jgi:hypothetical protein